MRMPLPQAAPPASKPSPNKPTWPLVHHLHVLLPGPPGQLALGQQLRKLGGVVGVCGTAGERSNRHVCVSSSGAPDRSKAAGSRAGVTPVKFEGSGTHRAGSPGAGRRRWRAPRRSAGRCPGCHLRSEEKRGNEAFDETLAIHAAGQHSAGRCPGCRLLEQAISKRCYNSQLIAICRCGFCNASGCSPASCTIQGPITGTLPAHAGLLILGPSGAPSDRKCSPPQ